MNDVKAGVSFAVMSVIKNLFWGLGLCLLACCGPQNEEESSEASTETFTEELNFLKQNIRNHPDSLPLFRALVDTLANRGLYAEAATWCDSAMLADKWTTLSWLLLKGDLYRMAKVYDSAIVAYRRYLSIFPEDEQILLNLANTYAEKGDSTCLALSNRIAALYPSDETKSSAAFISGIYYNVKGQYADARKWLDSAISLRYTFTEAWMERGYSLYDEKKFEEAEKNFGQLTNINHGNADAWYWRGKSAEAAGNTKDALNHYTRAYSLDRNFSEAQKAIERLKNQ